MEKTFEYIEKTIHGLLVDYQEEIETAYGKMGELSISLPVKIFGSVKGTEITVGISFATGKINEKVTAVVDDPQMSLPGMGE